ncbi:MAG TPA: 3-ketoacyl-ACP reductase, partial [Cyanobacteria bacterium UBA12227]|nr:3-ketoacyl-ACP reductase [Cyanobacteria bacterium UBA12227]
WGSRIAPWLMEKILLLAAPLSGRRAEPEAIATHQ